MTKPLNIMVLTPVYNDWKCLEMLVANIAKVNEAGQNLTIKVMAVNDGSLDSLDKHQLIKGVGLEILHLNRNVGHQKAIAIGVAHLANRQDMDAVVVMDSDGEDNPFDIPKLVEKYRTDKQASIIFAKRKSRQDSSFFKFFYFFYKTFFRLLTGKPISFGNFSLIPAQRLSGISHVSEIWNHYSGGVIKSRVPYLTLPLHRSKRYHGESKMNFVSLVIHGISSFAVHLEVVSVRLLLFTGTMIGLAFTGLCVVLYFRLFTDKAIPGWATFTMLSIVGIIVQAFFICVMLAFVVLLYRTQRLFIPATDHEVFIKQIEKIA